MSTPQESLALDPEQGAWRPLSDRMRPQTLAEMVGQGHLLGDGRALTRLIQSGTPHSMILWGPPGTGKTTLARVVAATCDARFEALSAVFAGVKDIRQVVESARQERAITGRPTVLFLDEVHRFNKSQQDTFLPFVEDGTLVFIGATTENPSFEVNAALLSRARVYVLKPLEKADLRGLLERALADWVASDSGPMKGSSTCSPRPRTATHVARSTCWRSRRTWRRPRRMAPASRWTRRSRSSAAGTAGSTSGASCFTTRSRRFTSRSAAAIRTLPSTGSVGCSTAVATRTISRAAS
jgi:adenylate kinase family enzyme